MSTYYGGPDQLSPMGQGPTPPRSKSRTGAIVAGLGVAGLAVAGVAVGATYFFSAGAQPAEALPDSTIAYVSVDLNPSGAQKVEAIRLLRKFPAFTDSVDVDEDSDLVQELFDQAIAEGECTDLNYADDVKPWLGARAAVAAVDAGEETPAGVVVIQVKDEQKATDGLEAVVAACGGSTDDLGVVVSGEWAVFAETQGLADDVADAASSANLADDATYRKWTDEAGGDAIVQAYVSPRIADYADAIADASDSAVGQSEMYSDDPFSDDLEDDFSDGLPTGPGTTDPEAIKEALSKFQGAAAAIRFDNAGLEVEFASGVEAEADGIMGDGAGELVGDLPASTVAAFGLGLDEDWLANVEREMAKLDDAAEFDVDELLSEVGITREDVTGLLGEGVAVAVGSGIDVDAVTNGGIEEMPAAAVVDTDVDALGSAIRNILAASGEDASELDWLTPAGSDGHAVVSPHDGFRDEVADPKERLKDVDEYKDVVEDVDDAQGLLFVNFNADDDWLVRILDSEAPDAAENVAPLAAFGVVGWFDDGVSHLKIRLTTD